MGDALLGGCGGDPRIGAVSGAKRSGSPCCGVDDWTHPAELRMRSVVPAAVNELVSREVDRPAIICHFRNEYRCPRSQRSFAASAAAHHQPLLLVDPKQPLMVHLKALPLQEQMQTPITEAAPLMRQCSQPRSQRAIVDPARSIADRHPDAARSEERRVGK